MITLESSVGNYITLNKQRYSYFAGNDYLGLANHPAIVDSCCLAMKSYGINFSASRKTTGTSKLHLELEKQLAEFKSREDAIVFASGYVGNRLLLHALEDNYSEIFMDSMAHPSIVDGIPRRISKIHFYNHLDTGHLEELLKQSNKPLVITDGIFALTGEIAPLDRIYYLVQKYNAVLIVDDAHATGVLGENGRGTPEHFHLEKEPNIFQTETLSKAFGVYGGFISATNSLVNKIRSTSTFYGASTALPPPIVAAGISAVQIVKRHPELRTTLNENTRLLREGVQEMEFLTTDTSAPIIPVLFENAQKAKKLSAFLEENLIIAPSIDYPVKTDKYIVRITVSANHSAEQIKNLLSVLKKWKD